MLKRKQLGQDDPMSLFGIMSMNNQALPYKKPILKAPSAFNVNTRGVLEELSRDHGGLKQLRSTPHNILNLNSKSHMMLMAGARNVSLPSLNRQITNHSQ